MLDFPANHEGSGWFSLGELWIFLIFPQPMGWRYLLIHCTLYPLWSAMSTVLDRPKRSYFSGSSDHAQVEGRCTEDLAGRVAWMVLWIQDMGFPIGQTKLAVWFYITLYTIQRIHVCVYIYIYMVSYSYMILILSIIGDCHHRCGFTFKTDFRSTRWPCANLANVKPEFINHG